MIQSMHSSEQGFLDLLADKACTKSQEEFVKTCYVFASKRAGTFFRYALAKRLKQTCFSPTVITIEDFAQVQSDLIKADNMTLLGILYAKKRKYSLAHNLPFDEQEAPLYLDQCEKMLSDFNDIDSAMAPEGQLFHNIKGIEELTGLDYLTEEQCQAIVNFWGGFVRENNGRPTRDYLALLEQMEALFPLFKKTLLEKKIGYDGMVCRCAAESSTHDIRSRFATRFPHVNTYIFAGLYAMPRAQQKMLLRFREALPKDQTVSFYWEQAPDPFPEQQKSTLLSFVGSEIKQVLEENKALFGGEVLTSKSSSMPRVEVRAISSSTARYVHISSLLERIAESDTDAFNQLKTAVICTDENELLPMLSALAKQGRKLNVTMGIPLSESNISAWIYCYLVLLVYSRKKDKNTIYLAEQLRSLLLHPLSRILLGETACQHLLKRYQYPYELIAPSSILENIGDDVTVEKPLKLLVSVPNSAAALLDALTGVVEWYSKTLREEPHSVADEAPQEEAKEAAQTHQIEQEFAYQYRKVLQQLTGVLDMLGEDLPLSTAAKLILKLVDSVKLSFEGEPLEGLQVMGPLEARLLRFPYLIIANANEGVLSSRAKRNNSYIPYTLRQAYGLATYRTREIIEAHRFYSLLMGSQRCYLLVNDNPDSEPSRYIKQLKYLTDIQLEQKLVSLPIIGVPNKSIVIERTPEIKEKLSAYLNQGKNNKKLSASALNTWVSCPMRFYLRYLEGIAEDYRSDDIVKPTDFGQVVHATMCKLYGESKTVDFANLKEAHDPKALREKVDEIYRQLVLPFSNQSKELKGIHRIYADVACKYVQAILDHDQTYRGGIYIEGLEKEFTCEYTFGESKTNVSFKLIIDRVDRLGGKDGLLRIVDYKTGSDKSSFTDWGQIFSDPKLKGVSQLFLYSLLISQSKQYGNKEKIQPALYVLPGIMKNRGEYSPLITIGRRGSKSGKTVEDFTIAENIKPYTERLDAVLKEIFLSEEPIVQTDDQMMTCSYCSFAAYCGRNI